ncbi:MAG: hypothetical protein CMH97_12680 [Oceanospirillaceae bacterium]|nr:hypothetical protein [Oceanospirillaceae bacterium]|tara:strand:- start:121 stop:762 length:642 start_codon:yes stop_codon:yes gene_type:complete
MNRRHKENTNLITIPACSFEGMYELKNNYKMVQQYLLQAERVMSKARNDFRRVTMIRFDLRFPFFWDLEVFPYGGLISDFFTRLNYALDVDSQAKGRRNRLRYVWTREFGEVSDRPHYHVTIFVNGDLYRPFRYFQPGAKSLPGMIIQAWADALGIVGWEAEGLVYSPSRGAMSFSADNYQSQLQAFQRMSYLCKVRTKRYGDGNRNFGCSFN